SARSAAASSTPKGRSKRCQRGRSASRVGSAGGGMRRSLRPAGALDARRLQGIVYPGAPGALPPCPREGAMKKKARKAKPTPPAPRPSPDGAPGFVPNPSLSRAARVGEHTEDELLLQRPRHPRPVPRDRSLAEFTHGDPWRVLRI